MHTTQKMLLLLIALFSCSLAAAAPKVKADNIPAAVILPIPWLEQRLDLDGFCGEVAVTSACMYYGCWISPESVSTSA